MSSILNENALELHNVSKSYRIYSSPMQRLKEIIYRKCLHSNFIALDTIDLTIKKGETFGIIGENGAGKSTLLKIIANTLYPTTGEVKRNGRISALLELGAGFNPELSGEENIFLNAYLMGLTKSEIEAKKHEIIDFSELDTFIKRPVKTYSSGMSVRLAFSIATSVNPDVLIIDEALSVGDEHFQKKCIDRMMDFRNSGKTIIFCSHSMYLVQELCRKAMWLCKGKKEAVGDAGKVISLYQNYEREKDAAMKKDPAGINQADAQQAKPLRIESVSVLDKNNNPIETINPLEPLTVTMKISCIQNDLKGHVGFAIIRNDEVMCFGTMTHFDGLAPISYHNGQEFSLIISRSPVLAGTYVVMAVVGDEHGMHPYDITRSKPFIVSSKRKEFGMTYIDHQWEI
jgi:ABC-type polysaccharide/polyol phosphate transport system ATPase subunit